MGGIGVEELKLIICPLKFDEAKAFIRRHHRHHKPPQGWLFGVACAVDGEDEPCGVATVGRPVSRHMDDGWTCEVTRLCVLPETKYRNAASKLLGACWRAARALGYKKCITYTLPEEGGASLRGAGWKCVGEAGGGSWNCKARPRVDKHPTQKKFRWEMT